MEKLLEVKDLHTSFFTPAGEVKAVNGVSFSLEKGKVLGIVGESGSGKSVTAYSILQILANPGKIVGGSILLEGEELENILTLTDENGNETEFEYLDSVDYQGKEYIVLIPNDEDATEIVILEVQPVDEELENYIAVEDEAILEAVYAIFKDRFKDILEFGD